MEGSRSIPFNFADFQLEEAIRSTSLAYIRSRCAAKIRRSDTFVLLIGNDTYTKTEFVQPEVDAAIEKDCRLIGVNLNNCRCKDWLCPLFFGDMGAMFVPFSSRIDQIYGARPYWIDERILRRHH